MTNIHKEDFSNQNCAQARAQYDSIMLRNIVMTCLELSAFMTFN